MESKNGRMSSERKERAKKNIFLCKFDMDENFARKQELITILVQENFMLNKLRQIFFFLTFYRFHPNQTQPQIPQVLYLCVRCVIPEPILSYEMFLLPLLQFIFWLYAISANVVCFNFLLLILYCSSNFLLKLWWVIF